MKIIFSILLFLLSIKLSSQVGSRNTSFISPLETINNNEYNVRSIDLQSTGKIIFCSNGPVTYNNYEIVGVGRLLDNGQLDNSFISGAIMLPTGNQVLLSAIHVLPNDKIILYGNFSNYNGVSCNGIQAVTVLSLAKGQ